MIKLKCAYCGKTLEGFSKKDVEYRLYVHMARHREEVTREKKK